MATLRRILLIVVSLLAGYSGSLWAQAGVIGTQTCSSQALSNGALCPDGIKCVQNY